MIQAYEKGQSVPGNDKMDGLAKALGVKRGHLDGLVSSDKQSVSSTSTSTDLERKLLDAERKAFEWEKKATRLQLKLDAVKEFMSARYVYNLGAWLASMSIATDLDDLLLEKISEDDRDEIKKKIHSHLFYHSPQSFPEQIEDLFQTEDEPWYFEDWLKAHVPFYEDKEPDMDSQFAKELLRRGVKFPEWSPRAWQSRRPPTVTPPATPASDAPEPDSGKSPGTGNVRMRGKTSGNIPGQSFGRQGREKRTASDDGHG